MPQPTPAFGLVQFPLLDLALARQPHKEGRLQPLGHVCGDFSKELQDRLLCVCRWTHRGWCLLEVNPCWKRKTATAGGWKWLPWQILLLSSGWMDLGSPFYSNACVFSATELPGQGHVWNPLGYCLISYICLRESCYFQQLLVWDRSDWIIVWEAVHLPQNDVGLKGL